MTVREASGARARRWSAGEVNHKREADEASEAGQRQYLAECANHSRILAWAHGSHVALSLPARGTGGTEYDAFQDARGPSFQACCETTVLGAPYPFYVATFIKPFRALFASLVSYTTYSTNERILTAAAIEVAVHLA